MKTRKIFERIRLVTPKGIRKILKRIYFAGTNRMDLYDIGLHLKSLGWDPGTVIDVGAADGTKELLKAFPKSKFILIEPLRENERKLARNVRFHDAEICIAAAWDEEGEEVINVHDHQLDGSSMLNEEMGEHTDGYQRRVKTIRIDNYIKKIGLKKPVFLKIDVQGSELRVLDGCQDILDEIEIVALEVSLFRFMKGQSIMSEVIEYMKERDYEVYDIIHGSYRPLDKSLGQIDIIFARRDCSLRKDQRYANR